MNILPSDILYLKNNLVSMVNVIVVSFLNGPVDNLLDLISNKFLYGNNFAGHVVQLSFGKKLLQLIIHF